MKISHIYKSYYMIYYYNFKNPIQCPLMEVFLFLTKKTYRNLITLQGVKVFPVAPRSITADNFNFCPLKLMVYWLSPKNKVQLSKTIKFIRVYPSFFSLNGCPFYVVFQLSGFYCIYIIYLYIMFYIDGITQ